MDKQNFPQPVQDESINVQRAFWVAIIFTVFALGSLGLLVYVITVTPAWQVYVITALTAIATIVDFASVIVIRRGRADLGLKMLYWSTMLSIIPNSFFTAGAGPILVAMVLLLGYVNVFYLQPRSWRRRYQYGPLLIALAIGAVEFWNPPFRFSFFSTPFFGPSALTFLVVSIVALVLYQARREIASSIRLKIIVWMGAIMIVLSAILVTYSVITFRQSSVASAEAEALAVAESQARQIQTETETPLSMARSLAQALTAVKDPAGGAPLSREQVNPMLRQILVENPSFLGTYTLWEPNAFDNLDSSYKNTPSHDASGRFIPYWVRADDGSISVIPLEQYETPGIGDWYILPRQSKQEMTFAPLIYPIGGVDVVMASFIVPITFDGQFYGIAGIDAPIAFVQEIVDGINLYDGSADAVLMTTSGTLIGVRNRPELVNQSATAIYPDFEQLQQRLETGESFISASPDGETLRVFVPVELGQSGSHWTFSLLIPYSKITAPATASALRQSLIGISLFLLSLLLLWYFTGQIASPIGSLTKAANAITGGDLNTVADVQTTDEIGVLAGVFNTMTAQLRGTLATLEARVADRTRNLELAAEVGRSVSQVRELGSMLTDAAELIRKQFDLYYVQVYLTDPSQTNLILRSGTGDVGRQLLARSHRLPLDTASINGRAAVEKKSVVIADTAASATFRPNPLLPNTRSEMAVPLLVGEKVAGVLDMQSEGAGVLSEEALSAFEALAGQLAIAIQNASLLAETEQARAEVEAQARRLTRANWSEYLDAIHMPEKTGFVFEGGKVAPQTEEESVSENALVSPIMVSGESLGNLIVDTEGNPLPAHARELLDTIARQVAQQVESLRLLESAERYRAEAEAASRRLTREGWKSYAEKTGQRLGYQYNLKEVLPLDGETSESIGATVPLKVRDEVVGKLAVDGLDPNDAEAFELARAVAERLGAHIESLRQFDETQTALAQSEKLFEASRRLTQAVDLQELTAAAVESINIPVVNRAILTTFNYDTDGKVEGLDVTANWWNGTGMQATAIGTHYTAEVVRMIPMFVSPKPLFFNDSFSDERVDPATMNLVKRLNLRTVAILPLHAGARQTGVLMLEGEEPHNFTEEEKRLFVALGPQISTVLENRRQFERAQKQAEREAMLNVINQKIQGATSVEAVLQIAARELGHALGAPMTIAQLSLKDTSA